MQPTTVMAESPSVFAMTETVFLPVASVRMAPSGIRSKLTLTVVSAVIFTFAVELPSAPVFASSELPVTVHLPIL